MRLPRDVTGAELATLLGRFGYQITLQTGSHIRLTTEMGGEHHVTIPAHRPLRIGTLHGVLTAVAEHLSIARDELIDALWGC